MKAIEIHDLKKYYGKIKAVDHLSLDINKGELFGLLGPNGAGKTSLLNLLQGILRADSGKVTILGMDYRESGRKIREKIGIHMQAGAFIPKLKVSEQLQAFAKLFGIPLNKKEIQDKLASAGLESKFASYPETLSGGQQQSLNLLITLLHDPDIIFLDEPTAGLDVSSRQALWDQIRSLQARGKTILLTTHNIEEAEKLCTSVGIIDKGKLIALGHPVQLIKNSGKKTRIIVSSGLEGIKIAGACQKIESLDRAQGNLQILTTDVMVTLRDLFRAAGNTNTYLGDLHICRPGLEDVFLDLTGRSIKNNENQLTRKVLK